MAPSVYEKGLTLVSYSLILRQPQFIILSLALFGFNYFGYCLGQSLKLSLLGAFQHDSDKGLCA